ncbi:amino acid adenylation domain-containing protein [Pseudoalteromonas xiamenensis]
MNLLSILVSDDCVCAGELGQLIYDLGHSAFINGDVPEKQAFWSVYQSDIQLDLELKTLPADQDGIENTLYISISEDHTQACYELCCVWFHSDRWWVVSDSQVGCRHAMNGADIYSEIVEQLQDNLTVALTRIAQGKLADLTLWQPAQWPSVVNLNALRFWHQANDTGHSMELKANSLFDGFKKRSQQVPQQIAIRYGEQQMSYGELDLLSERIAQRIKLRLTDVQSQPVIAIALHKSFELYATMLAVLRLGACYVPIDPDYPQERIDNIVTSASPDLLIMESALTTAQQRISISELTADNDEVYAPLPELSGHPDLNAVIICTSGSTGMPKGVQLTHGNILHFCDWYLRYAELDEQSRCLQFTTVSFDASLLDIFPTFLVGASLVVPSDEARHDFSQLDELIRSQNVSHCFIPPAMLSTLPEYDWPSMRFIITGGDVCDVRTIAYWSERCKLINVYGPTECTVLATCKSFSPSSNNKVLGQPIQNTRVYVINEQGEPCHTLEQGEVYLAGPGVGPGYFAKPTETTACFLPATSWSQGERLYRTGDIAYWDACGELNFVGRKDNQLKIRGFRVELGEIENTILRTRLYHQSVVIADDKKRIYAFVSEAESGADVELLRSELVLSLPDYMLPSQIIEVETFPATANGKVDRKQLLAMTHLVANKPREEEVFNDTELTLRQIWSDVLTVDELDIGRQVSFFDLGGHSLLVSKMLLAVKSQFEGNFTLARFMESPTIAALALLLSGSELDKGAQISDRIYADMVLDFQLQPLREPNPKAFSPEHILLTGANGFLGIHILAELLAQSNAIIYCLVRASSLEYGWKKLHDAWKMFEPNSTLCSSRVKVVCGDLAEPNLGLNSSQYEQLCTLIDVIYHNGAQVNHIYDYDYLYQANVQSSIDLLKMACNIKTKQMVYISTLSAASNLDEQGRIVEDGPADQLPAFVNNGYNLTKWVSEQLVWQAYQRGLPVTIVRPGNICGHSVSGRCVPDQNRILLLLKGASQLGVAPDWSLNFDLCPVDFIAKGLVSATLCEQGHVPVLHFHNPNPLTWKQYIGRLEHFGIQIRFVEDKLWRNTLMTLDESNALYHVVSFYLDENNEDIGDISHIDSVVTEARLAQFDLSYPKKDLALVDANLGFLINSQFIPRPQSATQPI